MTQRRLLQDGFYRCPECGRMYEIVDAGTEEHDGYCTNRKCEDDNKFPELEHIGDTAPENPALKSA